MAIYARGFSVEEKADNSPLTEADQAAHRLIMAGLAALPQRLPILSEEDVAGFAGPDAEGRYWLVDPLDGTKEFIKRNGEFTVNIALIENGRPVLGVVVAPALEVSYLAAEGVGAFKVEWGKGRSGERLPIRVAGKPALRPDLPVRHRRGPGRGRAGRRPNHQPCRRLSLLRHTAACAQPRLYRMGAQRLTFQHA